jgi:hypothetical protein
LLGSKSHWLLLLDKTEVFGESLYERIDLKGCETIDGDCIDPIIDGRGVVDLLVAEVLQILFEVVLGTGANCCCHNLEF